MGASAGKNGMYLIGDVAEIVGMSRDALRFYEKKGIIHARKKENGYRYYSENDIYKLMYIIYHRKMNTSLKDLEEIMAKDREDTVAFMTEYLSEAVKKEQEELESHKRAIARLKLVKKDILKVADNVERYCRKRSPGAYVIGRYDTFQEGMENWFRISRVADGLEMSYLFTEIDCSGENLKAKSTSILFYKEFEEQLRTKADLSGCEEVGEADCIYTVQESPEPMPDEKMVREMAAWGEKKGLQPGTKVFVNNLSSCSWKEDPSYFLEIYMPVARGES